MKIDYQLHNENLVAILKGDIDHHVAETIKNSMEKELDNKKAKNLILDFKNVNFMDSSGIGMIIGRYKFLEKKGGKVCVINLSENVDKLFKLSGLTKIIKIYENLSSCLKEI